MKLTKTILAMAMVIGLVLSASAQVDMFGAPRTIVVISPTTITGTYSNAAIDLHGAVGIAKLTITTVSNSLAGPLTITLNGATDKTNFTAISFASGVATTVITTNTFYGGQLKATNSYILPGTLTTPTASTSGWATTYISPSAFTSTSLNASTTGVYEIGFNANDAPRYINVLCSGSTNHTISAVLTVRKQID